MRVGRDLALALRLAGREMRGGPKGFGLFLACLAIGVGAMTAVGTLSDSVGEALRKDARTLLGGDLELSQSYRRLRPEALRFLRARGRVSEGARMRTMARSAAGNPSLVELKAVDGAYPLFGKLKLKSGGSAAAALAERDGVFGAVVDSALLTRLAVGLGDRIRLGSAELRITGVIAREPDKASRFFQLGPRLMVGLKALPGTGLVRPGSVVFYFYKVRLAETLSLDAVKRELKTRFPGAGWRVRDYGSATARLEHFFEHMTLYLTLVSLATLLVGGIGVAGAVRSHLESRSDSIAAMKCLGASRGLIVSIYLFQTLALALAGSALGIGGGLAFSAAVFSLIAESFGVAAGIALDPRTLLTAAAYGVLTALAFSLWPLSAAGAISPARLFRGYTDVAPRKPSLRAGAAVVLTLSALFGLTWSFTGDGRLTAGFAAAAAGSAVLFRALAGLMMKAAASAPAPKGPRLRQALANLHRPGALTTKVFFSLGLGLTALAAVALVEGNLRNRIERALPEVAPSYFFLDVQPSRIEEFRRVVRSAPGVSRMESRPLIRGRIVRINGVPSDEARIDPDVGWTLRSDRAMTYAAKMPEGTVVTEGKWWPEDYRGKPLLSLDQRIARGFGVGVGDSLTLLILGREIRARIASLRKINWVSLGLNHVIVLAPGALDGAPVTYLATAYAADETESALFRTVTRRFPNVVPVYIKDVLRDVGEILRKIGLAVRAMAWVTLATGLLVLVQALRANLRSRHYEAVIFKVVGATRRDIVLSLAAEFSIQGLATALLASLLGTLISYAFVEWVLRTPWIFLPVPLITIVAGGAGATLVLGLAGVRGVLGRKAWPVLRNE